MADQRTPEEQAGMSEAEQKRFPGLTTGQLNRRLWVWGTALVVLVIVIIVMTIVS
jgi:hypothetical protein